jgi:leucyl aminopeptidase
MRVQVTGRDLSQIEVDLAACFSWEGESEPEGIVDRGLRRELARQMQADRFRGRPGDRLVWSSNGRFPARRFVVIGLGRRERTNGLRGGCARAARAAQELSATSLAIRLPNAEGEERPRRTREAAEGALLGAYRFDRYLTDSSRRPRELRSIEISAAGPAAELARALRLARRGAAAVYLARDLVNEAPSRLSPPELARRARTEARRAGLQCRVLQPPELERIGMRALLAVARGSGQPARVVQLTYRPPRGRATRRRVPRVLLVGKGVTFDSGGLNLKPAESMLTMKMDMAGAAAVLATMTALAGMGCRAEVHGYLGLVENMTGGLAYKPGDILETWSGKTVEIGNTDAEGRLVLCDLLAYGVSKVKPTHVVDLATLTGACVVALGPRAAGLFTRHEALGGELLAASAAAGEKLWPLPLYDDYLQMIQKGPADLRNIGGRWGGAITAALYLGEFVPRELPWAHLDIAGPAFTEEDLPEAPIGATGAGVLTLLRWLEAGPGRGAASGPRTTTTPPRPPPRSAG